MRRSASGRVSFFRQPVNLGPQANFTDCVRRATGEWVHVLHGDDMVASGFYDALRHAAAAAPDIHAFVCAVTTIDADNRPVDGFELGPSTPGIIPDFARSARGAEPHHVSKHRRPAARV